MSALLEPLRQIARDLVAKRLWPVAALLLAAIVAVPMLIGSSPEQGPPPAPVAAVAPDAEAKSIITAADEAVTGKHSRAARIEDPFYDPPAPPEQTARGGSRTSAETSGGGTAASAKTSGGGTPTAGRPADTSATASPTPASATSSPTSSATSSATRATRPRAESTYSRTQVRWYETGVSKARPIARLTPLGGADDPAALFLGITRSSATYAVFLLAPNASSSGEGACEDDTSCRVIGLRSGESRLVTVQPSGDGRPRRYRLEVVSVRTVATDAATARTMRARVHSDGRDVMRAMWQDRPTAEALGPIRYDVASGLLVKTATAMAKKAAK